MHPLLARRRLALYLGLWVLVGALLAVLLIMLTRLDTWRALIIALPLATAYAFVCLSAWYVSRSSPLSGTGALRIVATAFSAALISSAAWSFLARAWIRVLAERRLVPSLTYETAGLHALFFSLGVLLYLLSLAISYLLVAFEHSREAERRALQVQVLAREAELRLLRTQIDPHFLFNSLHSISALTAADPAGARRMCLLLAEFLRESLALSGEERITLARELNLIDRFLAVERVRFGERLAGEIVTNDGANACLVPPLLLQPIVENAVTHGITHTLEGGTIRVAAARTRGRLTITVENPCDPDRPRRTGTGLGLANVRSRLMTLHGNEAWVNASESDGLFRVELSLPALSGVPASGNTGSSVEADQKLEVRS
jgi:two-component system, LytTR family, sensor histidine kinase AlgZ